MKTNDGFITTDADLDWLDDDDGFKLDSFIRQCEQDGFMPLPDDMPIPPPEGWEFRFHGPVAYVNYSQPPTKIIHL